MHFSRILDVRVNNMSRVTHVQVLKHIQKPPGDVFQHCPGVTAKIRAQKSSVKDLKNNNDEASYRKML